MTRVLRWFEREFVVFSCVSMGNKCALAVGPATPGTGGPDVGHCKMSAKIWWLSDRNPLDKGLNPKQERKKPLRYENCYAGTWADKYSSRRVTRTESKTKMNKHRSDTNRRHNNSCPYSSTLPLLYSKFDNTTNNNNRYVTNSLVFYSSDYYHSITDILLLRL